LFLFSITQKKAPSEDGTFLDCAAASYSHKGKPFTTIGAKKLNCCVRHGNRCDLLAVTTAHCFIKRTVFSQNWIVFFFCNIVSKPRHRLKNWLSPRPISIGPLHTSLYFHFQPIYLIISQGSYSLT